MDQTSMLPKSRQAEKEHRRFKRGAEVRLIIDAIVQTLGEKRLRAILEFGSGDGFQIPYLRELGDITASDIYLSDDIRRLGNTNFIQCSITDTPFADGQFDLIFSNHVIEHVDDLPRAFSEMRRIGAPDCLYAISVPTHIWLLLSVPGQYYSRAMDLVARFRPRRAAAPRDSDRLPKRTSARRSRVAGLSRKLFPTGHGVERRFIRCFAMFRISSWERLFVAQGFDVVQKRPLLLYGPSKWPVIPTMRSVGTLCSSVLFLLKKKS